jgi:HD-GYP domain-containing protein (c-di-GMP phosphodiesterase class II)
VIVLGLAAALDVGSDELSDLRRAALLHDVGKLAVSNRILDKPGSLTEAEFANVREHPVVTRQILERVPGFRHLAPVAAAHHERLDGRGYPDRLTAGELTVPMRLLAVADVYEALTSERPYRRAMSSEQALELVRSEVPHRLDGAASAALHELADGHRLPPALGPRAGGADDDTGRVQRARDRELVARRDGPRERPA